ncbi:MAG: SPFH domain-containing protein [Planctomycetes bacterium]|nr:SPFH domain-containing protein [Planctomycetota bacterium]
MGLWDKIKGELIDIIEWTDDSNDTMVYRFERYNNEIKYGAKLTVREGQEAVFVNEGKLADVFKPGMYSLTTENLPVLTTILNWHHGFSSPFKAEVYFVSTRRFKDLKWGTKNPIMMRDAEFGPVRLRAFGTYELKVKESGKFIKEVVGTDGHFTAEEITEQLRNIVVTRFTDKLGECKIPVLDMAGNVNELGEFIRERIAPEFGEYGLELTRMLVENISLPPAVEEALDKRSQMGVLGNLQAYAQFQTANAIPDAAKNPGGLAGAGAGLGLGIGMAGAMSNAMGQTFNPHAATVQGSPPPLPTATQYFAGIGGKQAGPFDLDALKVQIQSGAIKRDTLVWKQGMAQWVKAGDVQEVAALFGAAPPPLPQ